MWDDTLSMCAVADSMHDTHALCELSHPLRGLLKPLFMMHRHYVVYCVLFVGCRSTMWDVVGAMWAAISSVRAV